jgi:hypothetical protein
MSFCSRENQVATMTAPQDRSEESAMYLLSPDAWVLKLVIDSAWNHGYARGRSERLGTTTLLPDLRAFGQALIAESAKKAGTKVDIAVVITEIVTQMLARAEGAKP